MSLLNIKSEWSKANIQERALVNLWIVMPVSWGLTQAIQQTRWSPILLQNLVVFSCTPLHVALHAGRRCSRPIGELSNFIKLITTVSRVRIKNNQLCDRGKRFMKINSCYLREAFCNQSCFKALHFACRFVLYLVHPLWIYDAFPMSHFFLTL